MSHPRDLCRARELLRADQELVEEPETQYGERRQLHDRPQDEYRNENVDSGAWVQQEVSTHDGRDRA